MVAIEAGPGNRSILSPDVFNIARVDRSIPLRRSPIAKIHNQAVSRMAMDITMDSGIGRSLRCAKVAPVGMGSSTKTGLPVISGLGAEKSMSPTFRTDQITPLLRQIICWQSRELLRVVNQIVLRASGKFHFVFSNKFHKSFFLLVNRRSQRLSPGFCSGDCHCVGSINKP
ncbi:hypothetical protein [Rhodoferax ferrireducens]|uniref:hypothetical protein n=1 Tax=Rhodoferax ferrireducens TaxID=192843 RepID=UPI00130032A4|nr:hypothetical protein [Rhodoferax ferrireducens]